MAIDLGKIAITPKGEHTNITYEKLDLVTKSGSSYLSLKDNNSAVLTDTLSWQVIALKGIDGTNGINGTNGVDGKFFNYKGNVAQYTNLPTSGNQQNDAYYNETDKLWYVYNGTSFQANGQGLPIGVISIANTFDKTDVTKAQSGKSIYDFVFSKENVSVTPATIGSLTHDTPIGSVSANRYFILKKDHLDRVDISKIESYASSTGDYVFAIGSIVNNKFIERKVFTLNSGVYGSKEWTVTEYLDPNEYLAVKASTTSGNIPDLNVAASGDWYETTSSYTQDVQPSNYNLSLKITGISTLTEQSPLVFKTDLNKYNLGTTVTNYGSTTNNTPIGNLTADRYYILKVPHTQPLYVESIKVKSQGGLMHFVIGKLDQIEKVIEEESFSVNTSFGINTIPINKVLKVGSYLGIKTPGVIPDLQIPKINDYTFEAIGYTSPIAATNYNLAIELKTIEYIPVIDPVAKMTDIDELNTKIDAIVIPKNTIIYSPNGSKFKIEVSNSGLLSTKQVGNYTRILHFGNSILRHPITSFWWGDWGMAASKKEFDYASQFLNKIQQTLPTATSEQYNIALWEQNPSTYDKANFDPYFASNPNLVVVRLGENVVWNTDFKNQFRLLIEYFMSKAPTATFLIGGTFWYSPEKDSDMKDIADEKGITFATMQGLETPQNKSFVGDIVYDAANNPHTVDNQGVADHPNNAGMLAIATRLFNNLDF